MQVSESFSSGQWVTEAEYAQKHRLARQTLTNWRFRDRRAGRKQAQPGYPIYRYFGGAVRYWLPADEIGDGRPAA
jgi:hypothetical protein